MPPLRKSDVKGAKKRPPRAMRCEHQQYVLCDLVVPRNGDIQLTQDGVKPERDKAAMEEAVEEVRLSVDRLMKLTEQIFESRVDLVTKWIGTQSDDAGKKEIIID